MKSALHSTLLQKAKLQSYQAATREKSFFIRASRCAEIKPLKCRCDVCTGLSCSPHPPALLLHPPKVTDDDRRQKLCSFLSREMLIHPSSNRHIFRNISGNWWIILQVKAEKPSLKAPCCSCNRHLVKKSTSALIFQFFVSASADKNFPSLRGFNLPPGSSKS